MKSDSEPGMPSPVPDVALRRGSTGPQVALAQRRLSELGFYDAAMVDGHFGPLTEAAIRAFQARTVGGRRVPLSVDGIIGRATWHALFETASQGSLTALLSKAAEGGTSMLAAARSVAEQLRAPNLDWRHLTRALDEVRGQAVGSVQGAAAGLPDRIALLAMELARVASNRRAEDETAAADMLSACGPGRDAEPMLRDVLAVLRQHIPFDIATYAEYHRGDGSADDPVLARARLSVDGDTTFEWPARWLQLPAGLVEWAEGDQRWIPSLEDFLGGQPAAAGLRHSPVTATYLNRGVTSMLVARRLDGGRLSATLTLGRRAGDPPFTQVDQQRLDATRIEQVLRRIGEAYDAEAMKVARQLSALFEPGADAAGIGQATVDLLGKGFGWEYVGIFRVNRGIGQFEVVAQYDATEQLAVPACYRQKLSEGMLGSTLRAEHPLYAHDVRGDTPPHNYIRTVAAQASALCFPVRLGNRGPVEWILDLESSQTDAFPRPEQVRLEGLVRDVEKSLRLWFEARLNAALLSMVNVGVVVLGEGTRIERANPAARRLLGLPVSGPLPREPALRQLDHYAANAETAWELRGRPARLPDGAEDDQAAEPAAAILPMAGSASLIGAELHLRGQDGVERRALAGARHDDGAFHRRVWLLEDLDQAEWVASLRYMEAAVRTVVAQSRSRHLLAASLLRRTLATPGLDTEAQTLLRRSLQALASADLCYERIAVARDALATTTIRPVRIELSAMLRGFRASLPEEDASALVLDLPKTPVSVMADRDLLPFALRSLLGYLMAIRPPEATLHLTLGRAERRARVVITLRGSAARWSADTASPQVQDALVRSEAQAVASATHGLEAVRAVLTAHGGALEVSGLGDKLRLVLTGPLLARPSAKVATSSNGGG